MASYPPEFRVRFLLNDQSNASVAFDECQIVENATLTWGRSELLSAPDNRRLSLTILDARTKVEQIFDRAYQIHVELLAKLPGRSSRQTLFRGEITDATMREAIGDQWELALICDEALSLSRLGRMERNFTGTLNGPSDLIRGLGISVVNPPNPSTYYDLPPGNGRPGFGGRYSYTAAEATKMIGESQLLSFCALSPELNRMSLTQWQHEVPVAVNIDACKTAGNRDIVKSRKVRADILLNVGTLHPGDETEEYRYAPTYDSKIHYWNKQNPNKLDRAVNTIRQNSIRSDEKITRDFSDSEEGISAYLLLQQQQLEPIEITLRASDLRRLGTVPAGTAQESIFVPWEIPFAFNVIGDFLQKKYALQTATALHPIGGTLRWHHDDLQAQLTCIFVKAPANPIAWIDASGTWTRANHDWTKF